MKKILSLVLVMIFVLTLTGCSSSDEEVTVTLIQNKVEVSDQLEKLAAEYSEKTEGVTVEILGFQGNYAQQLASQLGTSTAPVIFSSNGASEFETYQEFMEPLTGMEVLNDAMDGSLNNVTVDDEVYGLPFTMGGLGFVYNHDMLDKLGLSQEDFSTPEKFSDSCKTISDAGYSCVSIAPDGYFVSAHLMNVPLSLQGGDPKATVEQYLNGEKEIVGDPIWEEWVKELEAFKPYMPDILSYSYDQQINDFANGKTAMISQGGWAQPLLDEYDIQFKYGFMPMQINGNTDLSVGVNQDFHINNEASDAEKEAAKGFLEWLFNDEGAKDVLANEMGVLPPYNSFDESSFQKLNLEIFQAAQSGNIIPQGYNYIPGGMVEPVLKPIMEKFFSGEIDGEELLKEIQQAFLDN